ncbi:Hypothetical predicted protein [Octopus vulgaris]|uniref:Uncharacterized protein n=1 Tax=Octopus vulgaris TaxID=6645 RepID=A0AA36AY79_OCTVU|nr:Hypothetical predicted protein [Octopus vulgaris]
MHEINDVMEDTKCDISAQEVAKRITILNAMSMLSVTWKMVSSQTIKHCWTKAGLVLAKESNEAIDINEDLSLPLPPTGLTKKQFENWLSVDDGAVVAPEVITEEGKLDEIIHHIRQSEKETEGDEDGSSDVDVDERVLEPPTPTEIKFYLTRLESSLESFDFSDMNLFRTLREKSMQICEQSV